MTALNIGALTTSQPSTSGSYTFSVTRDEIIRLAMMDIGALQEGEQPTASEISDCALKLNMLVKQWMGDTDFAPGLKVWTRKRADLFLNFNQFSYQIGQTGRDNWCQSTTGLVFPQQYGQTQVLAGGGAGSTVINVASTAQLNLNDNLGIQIGSSQIYWTRVQAIDGTNSTVTIPVPGLPVNAVQSAYVWNYTVKGVRPLKLISALLRDINQNDTPLRMLTVERYESLPTKTSPNNIGDPTAVFYEPRYKQQDPNGQLYIDVGCPQDVTKHLHFVYLAPVEDFVNPGDAPDYPQEWFRPLVLGLGKDIQGMFDCSWDLEDSLEQALAIARQGNPATTDVYFEVDSDDPYGA